MIEKLDLDKRNSFGTLDWLEHWNEPSGAKLIEEKINELVDAVNDLDGLISLTNNAVQALAKENNIHEKQIDELQMKLEPEKCGIPDGDDAIQEVIHTDPYAEQRKWIGKICEFWDNDKTQTISYGVLTNIDTAFGVCYCCNDEYDYDNCQPVKPDDDIIYKGE